MRISPGFCSVSNLAAVWKSGELGERGRSEENSDSGNEDITLVEG